MGIDWNRTTMTFVVLIIGSILLLTPVAIAVVGSGGTAAPGKNTSAGGPAVNASKTSEKNTSIANASQAGKITDKDIGYWPNGPAGSTFARNLKDPHFKAWIGGPRNPWIYGRGSNIMGGFGFGSWTGPISGLSPGAFWSGYSL